MAHARRLDLKAADRAARAQQVGGERVVFVERFEVHLDALRAQALQAIVEHGQRAVAEQVHLDEPERFDAVLVELRDDRALGGLRARGVVGDRDGRDDDAAGVQAHVARHVEQVAGGLDRADKARVVERKVAALGQRGKGLRDGVVGEVRERGRRGLPAGAIGRRPRQAFRPALELGGRDADDERGFAKGGAQPKAAERRYHRRARFAKRRVDRVQNFVAAPPAKVEVDVGAVFARRVEKALERQAVAQGIRVGEREAIRDEAVGGRAAADARDAARLGKARDLMHEQKVRGKAERVDRGELHLQALDDGGGDRLVAARGAFEREARELGVGRAGRAAIDFWKDDGVERGRERAGRGDRVRGIE